MQLLDRSVSFLWTLQENQTKSSHLAVPELYNHVLLGHVEVPEELYNISLVHMERHAAKFDSSIHIVIVQAISEVSIFLLCLLAPKLLPFFARNRVEFDPAVAHILPISFVLSELSVVFCFEEAHCLSCRPALVICSFLYGICYDAVTLEEVRDFSI